MLKGKAKRILTPAVLALLLAFVVTSGFGCKLQSAEVKEKMKPIELNFWSVYDDSDAYDDLIAAYQANHPNITISYRKFRYEEYERQLLEAWAEDRGPDIFAVPNSWLAKYRSKIEPMPAKITMAYVYQKGNLQKETVTELRTTPTITIRQLKDGFPDVVAADVIYNDQVYGLPLSLDTMVMYYNRDILANAGVVNPPATWNEFQEAAKKITRVGTSGTSTQRIIRSGAAMGTGANVDRAFDIISLLLLQNDAISIDSQTAPSFRNTNDSNPVYDAVTFYTDFAMPGKDVYSWNREMPGSMTAFMAGQVGMAFGYNYNLATIRAQSPKLRLGIAPVPQLNPDAPRNYANYWLNTVAKKSEHAQEAWDFVLYISSSENAGKYLEKTAKPAALKSLISEQLENEDLHSFALQALTAASWYRGYDPLAAEASFKTLADEFVGAADEKVQQNAIRSAFEKVRQTYIDPSLSR